MVSAGSSSAVRADEAAAVDVIVGVPVFNQARTIGGVVRAGAAALAQGLGVRGEVVFVDGGSTDDTQHIARAAAGDPAGGVRIVALHGHAAEPGELPFHGVPGRARALHALFAAVRDGGARAVVVVEASETALTPDWISRLLQPVLIGECDFVGPAYRRRGFDGALVRGIVAPAFSACLGLRMREPTGPDFACSARFVEHIAGRGSWGTETTDRNVDLWLTATAASDGLPVCEAPLGVRSRAVRDDSVDLSSTLAQVVGALFGELDRRASVWHRTRASRPVRGAAVPTDAPIETAGVEPQRLIESFRFGYRELAGVWSEILPPAAALELRRMAAGPPDGFRMDDRLWARIVYDFAVGYRLRVMTREHLLGAMTPLYLGWLASFARDVLRAGATEAELDGRTMRLWDAFESEKPYLISRWRWPERFQPGRF